MVYDNSLLDYQSHEKLGGNIIYIHDRRNSGVSKAYNIASDYAIKNGYNWILLLDQDTFFPPGSIEKYIESKHIYKQYLLFAPIVT